MSRNVVITIVVVILLVLAGWFLLRPKQPSAPAETVQPTEPPVTESTAPSATEGASMSEVKEITVSGTDFAFTPAKLSVKKGDKVKIVFQNNGQLPHNLMIDELKVASKTINAGQTDSVEFVADTTGSFTMYCSVDSHKQKGMVGTVSVQ